MGSLDIQKKPAVGKLLAENKGNKGLIILSNLVMGNPNLQVIIFSPGIDGRIAELGHSIAELIGSNNLEIFQAITQFTRRLQQPVKNSAVAILVAATKKDLADILAIHSWLERVKVILVLPDYETETIAQGHKLRPRFLTALGENLQEVVAVMKKMLAYSHGTTRREMI